MAAFITSTCPWSPILPYFLKRQLNKFNSKHDCCDQLSGHYLRIWTYGYSRIISINLHFEHVECINLMYPNRAYPLLTKNLLSAIVIKSITLRFGLNEIFFELWRGTKDDENFHFVPLSETHTVLTVASGRQNAFPFNPALHVKACLKLLCHEAFIEIWNK